MHGMYKYACTYLLCLQCIVTHACIYNDNYAMHLYVCYVCMLAHAYIAYTYAFLYILGSISYAGIISLQHISIA